MSSSRRLNRNIIRALKPGQSAAGGGIIAERTETGDTVYRINIMVDRRRIHRVVGRASEGTTLTQAEDAVAIHRTRAKEDRLNLPRGRKVALLFGTAATDYISRLKEEGGKTIERKQRMLALHLTPFFETCL